MLYCNKVKSRNFSKRSDGNPNTHAFVASPEIVTALTIAGDLTFNPISDYLVNESGEKIKLNAGTYNSLYTTRFDYR